VVKKTPDTKDEMALCLDEAGWKIKKGVTTREKSKANGIFAV